MRPHERTRILWMDGRVVDGAIQINCTWYLRPPVERMPEGSGYTHDCDEILGFPEVIPTIPMIWEAKLNSGWRMNNISSPEAVSSSFPKA
jgi:hypothetical protein